MLGRAEEAEVKDHPLPGFETRDREKEEAHILLSLVQSLCGGPKGLALVCKNRGTRADLGEAGVVASWDPLYLWPCL